jgi:hypothetical protein
MRMKSGKGSITNHYEQMLGWLSGYQPADKTGLLT